MSLASHGIKLFVSSNELKQMSLKTAMWLYNVLGVITDDEVPMLEVLESMHAAFKEQKSNELRSLLHRERDDIRL